MCNQLNGPAERTSCSDQLDGPFFFIWSLGQFAYLHIFLLVCALSQLPSPTKALFEDGAQLEVISETTLLSLVILTDLSWGRNTEFICQKARRKLWILRRLLSFDLNIYELFDVYTKEVRSLLELAVPVWHPGHWKHTKNGIQDNIANQLFNYSYACNLFSTGTLESRRVQLCTKFALKNFKSENSMFTKVSSNVNTYCFVPASWAIDFLCNALYHLYFVSQ